MYKKCANFGERWYSPPKGNGGLEKQAKKVVKLVYDENDCRFEVQREEYLLHMRPWSLAVRDQLLVTKLLDVIQVLDSR